MVIQPLFFKQYDNIVSKIYSTCEYEYIKVHEICHWNNQNFPNSANQLSQISELLQHFSPILRERLSCYHISPLKGLSILYTISESQILISLNMKSTPDWGFRFPPLFTHTYICCSTNFPLYHLGRIPDKHINDTNRTHFWLIPIDRRPLIEVQGIGNWVKCQLVL